MKFSYIIFIAFSLIIIVNGCKKDEDPSSPVICLKSGESYTPNGAIVKTGGMLRFGITARDAGVSLTDLVIKKMLPDGSFKVVLDSGMNSGSFSVDKIFYQNVEDTAEWIFQIMDRNRHLSTTSITVYKDPSSAWGGILEYSLITMGFQQNTTVGQFLCCATGKVFKGDSAGLVSDSIDIATCYFVDDNLPSPTFSSPGEYGGGILEYYPFISSWNVKNYTLWDISVDSDPVPEAAYDACHNDSLLMVSYDEVWGKKKFKWAEAGDIIPFLTAKGKKGLIRVISAENSENGIITFSMKVQQ
jgi:hypothetical protein